MASKKKVVPASPNISIEDALKTLQSLGFKVIPPNEEEIAVKEEVSLEKLGFKDSAKRKKGKAPIQAEEEYLVAVLGIMHNIGEQTYGPGEIRLPRSQAALFNSLIYQDQLARQAHLDCAQYNPVSGHYMIRQGNGQDRHNKFRKTAVTEAQFNSDSTWDEATITSGKFDISGYNPSFNQENRSF